jgi:hypothetical protein
MASTIKDGGLISKDPSDVSIYVVDWGEEKLSDDAEILTSTFTVSAVRPTSATLITKDQEGIVTGNRKTRVRIAGGEANALYEVTNRIVTDESPSQTLERSFRVLVEQR